MRFRPSIYSQVQLTAYAPNGGYPGFYGQPEEQSAPPPEKKEKGAFGRALDWLWGQFGGEVTEAAGEGLTRLTTGGGRAPSTTGAPATTSPSTMQIPSDLTPAEKALLDACKKEPLFKRASCTAKAIAKIQQQRAQATAGGGGGDKKAASNTLWWVLGGVVVAGGVAAVLYTRKRR
jgi:hypothetical protein